MVTCQAFRSSFAYRACVTRPIVPTVLLHLLAVTLLAGLAWFIRQPIRGDVAMWTSDIASFLVIAIGLILAGCLAWWRLGSRRALVLADFLALPPIAFASLVIFFIPVTATAAVLLLIGAVNVPRAGYDYDVEQGQRTGAPRTRTILILLVPVLLIWLDVLTATLEGIGGFVDYALPSAVLGGVVLGAIVLWLDGRPGLLSGLALALAWFSGGSVLFGLGRGSVPIILEGAVMVATALFAAGLAIRDIRSRTGSGQLVSLAIAVGSIALAAASPLLAPLAIVVSLALERPRPRDPKRDIAQPGMPEVAQS